MAVGEAQDIVEESVFLIPHFIRVYPNAGYASSHLGSLQCATEENAEFEGVRRVPPPVLSQRILDRRETHRRLARIQGHGRRGPSAPAKAFRGGVLCLDCCRTSSSILGKSFERLRRLSGIVRHDGPCYQPRLHDLRATFAVHRLTAWFKQGADLNRMLPALSAYLGQVGLGSTERYLSMTPERFRKQLVKLSPQRRKRRWRDNPAYDSFWPKREL